MKFEVGKENEGPEPGMCRAYLKAWIDRGTEASKNAEYRPRRKVQIQWVLDQNRPDGSPHTVNGFYSQTFSERSKLRIMLETWRGKPYQISDVFEPAKALGQSALLNVTINERGYADAMSVNPLPRSMEKMEPVDTIYWSMDEPDWSAWEQLHEKTQEAIEKSPEYQALKGTTPVRGVPPTTGSTRPPDTASARQAVLAETAGVDDFDDPIPF